MTDPSELLLLLGDWMAGPGPLYGKLAHALHRAVLAGDLGSGARLPSERGLAKALGVSRATVVAAYDELRALGAVESRRGSGTRIAARPVPRSAGRDGRVSGGRATALLQRLVDRRDETISLAMAAEPAAAEVREALHEVLCTDLTGLMADTGYHPSGLPVLRRAAADHFAAAGLPTTPEQVLVTTGATQALGLVAQLYLRKGSGVVVECPSWPGCLDVFRAAGARPHAVPLDQDGIRVDGLAEALTRHRPELLYVTPTYHNPTGVLMSEGRRRRVAELCRRHAVPVLEDIAYDIGVGQAAGEPAPIAAFAEPGAKPGTDTRTGTHTAAEVLTVGSLAKAVWGGLRIGWVRGPADVIGRLARLKALADLGSPVLDQALAARLLPRLDELKARRAVTLRRRLDHLEGLLAARLPAWQWSRPAGGSALWVRLPGDTDAQVYAQVALRHRVEVVPGAVTDASGAHDSHIRIPFSLPEDRLTDLANRLAAAWAELVGQIPPAGRVQNGESPDRRDTT
ncbi:PLP-dependent aminotransferase family protein [Streptomyces sp. P1-3]|uniref:aminotransferase-like domain-containing protein n=1 Tax=Streptomyces sp. P1-3 TaxID=3421658 RepID=UPI003D359B26